MFLLIFNISYLHFRRICYIILLGKVIPCHSALGHNQNVHRSEYIKTPTVVSLSETVVWGSRTSAPLPGFEAVCSSPYWPTCHGVWRIFYTWILQCPSLCQWASLHSSLLSSLVCRPELHGPLPVTGSHSMITSSRVPFMQQPSKSRPQVSFLVNRLTRYRFPSVRQ